MSQEAEYHVKVFVNGQRPFYYISYVYAGLWLLSAAGTAQVEFLPPWPGSRYRDMPAMANLCLHVRHLDSNLQRLICIDVHDCSSDLALPALRRCDVYFKRSFYQPDLMQLPADLAQKVRPFGMVYACRIAGHHWGFLQALVRQWALRSRQLPGRPLKLAREALSAWRPYCLSPTVQSFECPPQQALQPTVLFQTRLWDADDTSDQDVAEINHERAELVRVLRRALGERFVGGLIPTDLARRQYPDALSSGPTRRDAYVAMARRSLLGVYTRGLHHSIAYKFPEYLAGSKCIVSHPLRHQLPNPLTDPVNYLSFQAPDACAQACVQLLDNPEQAAAMRQANFRYYRQYVRPDAHLLRCFQNLFEAPVPTADAATLVF